MRLSLFRTFTELSFPCSGTVAEYVASHGMLTDYTSTRLMRKVVEGLQYLHECCLIHANLTVSGQPSHASQLPSTLIQ